jgi:predicted dinucleotide-binding enzyme
VKEAAKADIVLLTVPRDLHQAVADLPPWEDRIVIDPTNPLIPPDFHIADLSGKTSSKVVADLVPGARLVKALNTLPVPMLGADPSVASGRRVLFLSGDDVAVKDTVGHVLDKAGFATIDLGALVLGAKMQQFPGGPLATLNLIKLP